jgi:hypothetical protein
VLAITTLYLVTQGTEVVTHGKRRWVDAHWFRGQSYLKIGWHWVHLALSRGYALMTRMHLSPEADPAPAMASKIQHQKQSQPTFRTASYIVVRIQRENLSDGFPRSVSSG